MNARRIVVRKPAFDFDPTDIPVHWHNDNVLLSHIGNSLHLVFPAGERFFVRSVLRYKDQVSDPDLLAQIRQFAAQEARHGYEHEQSFAMLEAQGFELKSHLGRYERIAFELLEPNFPEIWALATTAALEHFTAILAEQALETDNLDAIHPTMRSLLRWHACEEIEHKAVAYDVLQVVDPRLRTRIAGLVIGVSTLLFFWTMGTRHLLRQDPAATRDRLKRDRKWMRAKGLNRRFLLDGARQYIRRGFHPDDNDNYALAQTWLRSAGMEA